MRKKDLKYWIAGAIFVIIVMAATFPYMIAKSRLESLKAELRKTGEPATFREYTAKYYKSVPGEDNAAGVLKDACSVYEKPKEEWHLIIVGYAFGPRYDQKISPLLLPELNNFLKDNSDYFDKLNKLKQYNYIRFKYNWDKVEFIMLTEFRDVVKALAVKMELLIHENKPLQSEVLLTEMFHFNKLVSQNPFMIGQLVFYSCDSIVLDSLERCMNTLTFTSGQLGRLQTCCAKQEAIILDEYPHAWQMELCFVLNAVNMKSFEFMESPYESYKFIGDLPIEYRRLFYYYNGSYFNDISAQVKAFQATIKVPLDVYPIRKGELKKIDDELKVSQNEFAYSGSPALFYLKALEVIASLRCAATACAVERYRLKRGKLPKDLNALVPEFMDKVPIDPFDGKALRYFRGPFELEYREPLPDKKEKVTPDTGGKGLELGLGTPDSGFDIKTNTLKKKGFYIYSIGRDLKDDIGEELNSRIARHSDIIFLVVDKK